MPLIFSEEPRIWWPVTFYPPSQDGDGRNMRITSNFLWELCSTDLLQATGLSDEERSELLRTELVEKIHDWDIEDVNHDKIPCNENTIGQVMRTPWIASRLMEEWLECSMGGGAKKKSKGLRNPSAGG